jgi:hypothetical protein
MAGAGVPSEASGHSALPGRILSPDGAAVLRERNRAALLLAGSHPVPCQCHPPAAALLHASVIRLQPSVGCRVLESLSLPCSSAALSEWTLMLRALRSGGLANMWLVVAGTAKAPRQYHGSLPVTLRSSTVEHCCMLVTGAGWQCTVRWYLLLCESSRLAHSNWASTTSSYPWPYANSRVAVSMLCRIVAVWRWELLLDRCHSTTGHS